MEYKEDLLAEAGRLEDAGEKAAALEICGK
jgi:hypothetical protein